MFSVKFSLHYPTLPSNFHVEYKTNHVVCCVFIPILIFLGLSERLEVQEMYENLQEERLDTLQEDLVTCIEGEEGLGGSFFVMFFEKFMEGKLYKDLINFFHR